MCVRVRVVMCSHCSLAFASYSRFHLDLVGKMHRFIIALIQISFNLFDFLFAKGVQNIHGVI